MRALRIRHTLTGIAVDMGGWIYKEVIHHMSTDTHFERELERRLVELETTEAADPAHAMLSGRTLAGFLGVVVVIAAIAAIGALL